VRLEDLNLSRRTLNVLRCNELTVCGIRMRSDKDLLALPWIGPKIVQEVRKALLVAEGHLPKPLLRKERGGIWACVGLGRKATSFRGPKAAYRLWSY
jgi:hypothetical protein